MRLQEHASELLELLKRQEELDPELKPYLSTAHDFPMLQHPLVYCPLYTREQNALLNAQLRAKKERLAQAEERGCWAAYILFHEKPWRFHAFTQIAGRMSDQEYWELFGDCWTGQDNLFEIKNLRDLLCCERPKREHLMRAEEHEFLRHLPQRVRIYRGHQFVNYDGYCWSLSPQKGTWFANRWADQDGELRVAECDRSDILAVFLRRGSEREVVVDPEQVEDVAAVAREPELETIAEAAESHFFRRKAPSDHGPLHWNSVDAKACLIAKEHPEVNLRVVRTFAAVHDCQRRNENEDPQHGRRAAQWIHRHRSLFQRFLDTAEIQLLQQAVCHHTDGASSQHMTVAACWDADRLDLPRVGITINPQLLSTPAARRFITAPA